MAFVPILMAATAAIGAIGALSASKAQAASYKSQQTAANYNAAADRQNAISAEAAGSANELAMRRQNDQILGRERASVAQSAGGFTGTNVGVLEQNGTNLELNALNSRYKSTMDARGLLLAANQADFQGDVAGMNASSATTSGYFGAASQALGAVSSYSTQRYLASNG